VMFSTNGFRAIPTVFISSLLSQCHPDYPGYPRIIPMISW
jgi:hypothetical protein